MEQSSHATHLPGMQLLTLLLSGLDCQAASHYRGKIHFELQSSRVPCF